MKCRFRFMVFHATFNNISAISWRFVLLVEEIGVPGESYWRTLSHNVVSSTPRLSWIRIHNVKWRRINQFNMNIINWNMCHDCSRNYLSFLITWVHSRLFSLVIQSLVFTVVFHRSLFDVLFFFVWSLHSLSVF